MDDWLATDHNWVPTAPSSDGLVAWYQFENDWTDSSGNGYDGTAGGLTTGPTFVASRAGFGQAAQFGAPGDAGDAGRTGSVAGLTD
jgi:hypothetical protein